MSLHPAEPAQLLVFVLQSGKEWDDALQKILQDQWGSLRHLGEWHPFNRTDYYVPEMGEGLHRAVASFERLVDPGMIAQEKLHAIAAEKQCTHAAGGRSYNFDIGYMDTDKVVLPSCKQGPWKVYWGEGIWLDIVMRYAKGNFSGTAWTFEDFVRNPYQRDLQLIREKYRKAVRVGC